MHQDNPQWKKEEEEEEEISMNGINRADIETFKRMEQMKAGQKQN